jgi:murein DD-endopeptidase MepM/ murein hydrolase activator NlpD
MMNRLSLIAILVVAIVSFSFIIRPSKKTSKKAIGKSLAFPVAGYRSHVGSFWGDDRDGGARSHEGIDVFAPMGTPVVAISDGIIIDKGVTPRGGRILWLQSSHHPMQAYYAHLNEWHVKEGEYVRKGQVIGTVGKTGNARTTPPHLHFGMYTEDGAVNPYPYVKHSPKVVVKSVRKKHTAAKKLTSRKQAAKKQAGKKRLINKQSAKKHSIKKLQNKKRRVRH